MAKFEGSNFACPQAHPGQQHEDGAVAASDHGGDVTAVQQPRHLLRLQTFSEGRRRAATVIDVAHLASVSVGTVSNVLSGARYVRPETRASVERAMRQLSFRPNRVAGWLRGRRTKAISVIVPDVSNPFFAELMRGAEDVFSDAGYVTAIGNSDNDPIKEERYLQDCQERQLEGLLFVVASEDHCDYVTSLARDVATVLVDCMIDGWPGDAVCGDNMTGMRLVVDHLISLGHTRIAFVGGPAISTARQRLQGFTEVVQAHGLEPAAISEGAFTIESGHEQALGLLRDGPRFSAICAANDQLALGALLAGKELGISVPDQLSITGYDDIAYAQLSAPALTTVRQSGYEMGQEAARLLMGSIADGRRRPTRKLLQPKLIVRSTTARARETQGPA
jgi:DNA-binding LacI/PurR family transcriptional regulator